jgi:hypothetical protein
MAVLIGMFSLALLWIPVPGFKSVRVWLTSRLAKNDRLDYDLSKTVHRALFLIPGLPLLLHITAEFLGIEKRQGILMMHLTPQRPLNYRGGQFAFLTVRTPWGKRRFSALWPWA